jgi:HSP20 family protein
MKGILSALFFSEVETCVWPLLDLYETGDYLVCEVDAPGIDPADISVQVYEDLLIIEGVRTEHSGPCAQDVKYLCMERGVKTFRRVVKMPVSVNTMAGEAFYANGVITIRFPKLQGKLIKIKIERKGDMHGRDY